MSVVKSDENFVQCALVMVGGLVHGGIIHEEHGLDEGHEYGGHHQEIIPDHLQELVPAHHEEHTQLHHHEEHVGFC